MGTQEEIFRECHERLARGATLEDVIRILRNGGFPKVHSIKALVDLGQANLIGVPGVEHWRITAAWNQWQVNLGGRIPSQAEIEGFALGIDAAFFDVMTRLP